MKYGIVQITGGENTGKWAVSSKQGKRYFTNSIVDTKEEAIELSIIRSLTFYYDLSRKLYTKLEKDYPNKYGDEKINFGDIIC